MDKDLIEEIDEGSMPALASGTYLVGFGPVVGNTTSHWVNLDVPLFEAPEDVSLSPYSRDDVIQRLMGMLLVARRELDIRQKNEPASMPEQFALQPLESRHVRVKIRKTLTPQFKFIEDWTNFEIEGMAAVFPWYCVVDGERIEQGDLITRCQLVLQTSELIEASDEIPADWVNYDIVVLTQSCDLIQGKVDYVVVCPHWDLGDAQRLDPTLRKSGVLDLVRKRQMLRYAMMTASDISEMPMAIWIVDFGQVFSVPKAYLAALARRGGKRLRLLPPYRESIAQAFASFLCELRSQTTSNRRRRSSDRTEKQTENLRIPGR